ncbi:MAG: response regulator transcription factor [Burkholderiales bacterium]|nr:response regulator transcription factor [Anaerolineae bacterium]
MFKNWRNSGKEESNFDVFVVSDDASILSLIQEMLTPEGCIVHSAANPQEAIQMLDGMELPDVLIGDFRNPAVDGKAYLDIARTRFGKSTLPPVLFLMDTADDESAAHALHVDDVLSKPFDGPALLACISELVKASSSPKP